MIECNPANFVVPFFQLSQMVIVNYHKLPQTTTTNYYHKLPQTTTMNYHKQDRGLQWITQGLQWMTLWEPKRAEGASPRDQRAASLDAPDVIEGNLIPESHMYIDSVDMTKCVIARYNPKYT